MRLLGVTVLVLAAGAAGWLIARRPEHAVSLGAPPRQATATATVERTGMLPSGSSFEVWLVRKGRLVEALRAHRPTPRVATAALDALLAGPTGSERSDGLTTQVPPGTRLLGVSIARGVANVDLSSDYQNAAGSRALQLRLAQVVYTATQFPTVESVRFSVDGTPVNVFSGSGIVLSHPVGRRAYRRLAPVVSPLAGRWQALPPAPVGPLTNRVAAWTGREVLILGQSRGATRLVAYRPAEDAWRRLPAPPPLARSFSAAWTGKELVAWGSAVVAYSPATGRWRRLPRPPFTGSPEILAWTGHDVVGWTGFGGAAYDPATNRWRKLPPAPIGGPTAWTGRQLLLVAGLHTAAFRPESGWRRLIRPPKLRTGTSVSWDGKELLVVGGEQAPRIGLAYNPRTNAWRKLAPMDSGRRQATAVWTGKRLLLWGGETGPLHSGVIPPHGLAYDPQADRWSPLPQAPLRGRRAPIGVWTGRSLLVWGGDPGFADGAAFTPSH